MKHDISWEDDGIVGVLCWVKPTLREIMFGPHAGEKRKVPAYGGSIGSGGGACVACGMKLKRTWKVSLHEVTT